MVAVADAEGAAAVFDGDGSAGVADANVYLLAGDDEATTTADAPFDTRRFC
ncbi:hypothetical protein [Micromonospora sp. URMC 103]|uniref:hypothetical protein n=1 Tax=Micromonospora sp. URMC 103 TaxID=3423406 RepID=UPI003F1ACA85